ncbi:MAG: enoyl-CoA hydratase-related protein [Acidimicrobiales bacterium]
MPIHYEKDDEHVVLITIDRPEVRNALDLDHFTALADAWRRVAEDDDAWVAIVTGVPGAFCAGADLKTFIPQATEMQKRIKAGEPVVAGRLSAGTDAVLRSFVLYKPIIAAVDGPCVAGGMEMLGGVDIRLSSPTAVFGVLEPRRGLFAGGGTTARLPRQLPWPAAMEFLLTAEAVPAERALALGLLNEIVPSEQLLDRAFEWARRITVNAPLAVQATKESALRCLAAGSLEEAYAIESRISTTVFATEDAVEGPKAFAEKRPPVWRAR